MNQLVRYPRVDWRGVIRVCLGLVLLAAAGLKAHQTVTRPSVTGGFLSAPEVVAAATTLEVGLGLLLVAGAYPRVTRQVAFVCFTVFAGVASYKTAGGESSCGCFGQVQVPPWQTLVFDIVALVALAVCGGCEPNGPAAPIRRSALAFAVPFALVPGFVVLALAAKPVAIAADGAFVGSGRVVVLHPEDWVGKPFPLLPHIEISEDLRRGRWTVILFQRDCPKCRKALAQRPGREGERVALIEVSPPGGRGAPAGATLGPNRVYGRLTGTKDWFVELPVHLDLTDGAVSSVQIREGG